MKLLVIISALFIIFLYITLLLNVHDHEMVHVANCKHICKSNSTININYLTLAGETYGCKCATEEQRNLLHLADSFNEAVGYNIGSLILAIFLVGILISGTIIIICHHS